MQQVRIVELKTVPLGALMLHGLPDVGLVGLIATSHIITELKLKKVAYVDSDLLPPITVLHEGLPHAPLRMFGDDNIIASISESPIPTGGMHYVIRKLVEWGLSKKVKMMISVGGMPVPNRQDLKKLKVYGAASNKEVLNILLEKDVKIIKEGFMVGPQALILRFCAETGVPAITLLAESFYNYPDPEAAAAVLEEIKKITGIETDVSKLVDRGEEIRLKARDIMKRTQAEMTKMRKTQEYDLPLYV